MRARSIVLALLAVAGVAVGCTSPEATRVQGGGPGADVGNRGRVVQMHEGSRPFEGTPRLVGPVGMDRERIEPARTMDRLSRQ